MDDIALFILALVVIIVVIALVVLMWWPSHDNCDASDSSHHFNTGAGQSAYDCPYKGDRIPAEGEHFDSLSARLGDRLFDLIEAVNTPRQDQVRKDVDRLINAMANQICDAKKAKNLREVYSEKVDMIVRHASLTLEAEFNQSDFSHSGRHFRTPTGSHSSTDRSSNAVKSDLVKVKFELACLSTALAEIFGMCASVKTEDLTNLFNLFDEVLVNYNHLYNVKGDAMDSKKWRQRHVKLWQKLHLS